MCNWLEYILSCNAINIVCDIAMAVSAGVAAWVAFKWKSTTLTKAKMEIAGQVLVSVLEMEDLFKFICYPSRNDTERQKALAYYSERRTNIDVGRIDYLIPLFRIENNKNKFENFFNLRNKVAIYWKDDALKSFDEIMKVCQQIHAACDALYNQAMHMSPQQRQEYEQIIYGCQNSTVTKDLNRIFKNIRKNMNAVLGNRKKWDTD